MSPFSSQVPSLSLLTPALLPGPGPLPRPRRAAPIQDQVGTDPHTYDPWVCALSAAISPGAPLWSLSPHTAQHPNPIPNTALPTLPPSCPAPKTGALGWGGQLGPKPHVVFAMMAGYMGGVWSAPALARLCLCPAGPGVFPPGAGQVHPHLGCVWEPWAIQGGGFGLWGDSVTQPFLPSTRQTHTHVCAVGGMGPLARAWGPCLEQ